MARVYISVMTVSSISRDTLVTFASVQNTGRVPGPATIGSSSTLLNGSHADGAGSIRTGLQIIPSPHDTVSALSSSASQIARLQSNPAQPTARAASEAYQTESAARTQINLHPGQSTISERINLMA